MRGSVTVRNFSNAVVSASVGRIVTKKIDSTEVPIAVVGDASVESTESDGYLATQEVDFDTLIRWIISLPSVTWAKAYGGSDDESPYSVAIAGNGDIIVAGSTKSFGAGKKDVWVLRLDREGNVKWQKAYGGSEQDEAYAVSVAPNGDIIVAGYTASFAGEERKTWILRLDENGDVKWQKAYKGSYDVNVYAITIVDNGDIIVAGQTSYQNSIWIMRLDENGNIKWQKAYVRSEDDRPQAVAVASNGDIIVAGHTWDMGFGEAGAWVLRLDENGNLKWIKTYSCGGNDAVYDAVIAPNGDIILVGFTDSFGAGSKDFWVLRLDENGDVKWQKTYGGSNQDEAYGVAITSNGDIVVTGNTTSFGAGGYNGWVIGLDDDGNVRWQKAYGGDGVSVVAVALNPVAIASNGDIVVSGVVSFGAMDVDVLVLRLDKNGNVSADQLTVTNTNCVVMDTNCTVADASCTVGNTDCVVVDTNCTITETNCTVTEL